MVKPKFKIGDLVIYLGDLSDSGSNREPGDSFTVRSISTQPYTSYGPVYFPIDKAAPGEFECDLRLGTKLEKALK